MCIFLFLCGILYFIFNISASASIRWQWWEENSISGMFRIKKNGNSRTTGPGRELRKEKQKLRSYF